MYKKTLLLICVFILGIVSANIYAYIEVNKEPIFSNQINSEETLQNPLNEVMRTFSSTKERPSPLDRIKEEQILVTNKQIVINLENAKWAEFTDTNSMDPVIDAGSHAIEIIPQTEKDVQIGDIVAYKSEHATGTIIHRIVYKGEDEKGTYYIMKGDNNPSNDPGKVRFEQITRVVVAIIY
jgi:hypothetical protein